MTKTVETILTLLAISWQAASWPYTGRGSTNIENVEIDGEELEMMYRRRGDPSFPSFLEQNNTETRMNLESMAQMCFVKCQANPECRSMSISKEDGVCMLFSKALLSTELVHVDAKYIDDTTSAYYHINRIIDEVESNVPCGTYMHNTQTGRKKRSSTFGLNPDFRIVGGEETENFVPWQVGISSADYPFIYCGGSLIDNKHVITAAHCVNDWYFFPVVYVTFGRYDISTEDYETPDAQLPNGCVSPPQPVTARVIKHENYSSWTLQNDIALLVLDDPVDTNCWNPVCLPTRAMLDDDTCHISGWGTLEEGGAAPNVLHIAEVNPFNSTVCQADFGDEWFFPESMICAAGGFVDGSFTIDSCQGDSGGPLFCQGSGESETDPHVLQGVVSWGYGCAGEEPGVYTNVFNYVDWINSEILAAEEWEGEGGFLPER